MRTLEIFLIMSACAHQSPPELSAEAHRKEAAAARDQARDEVARYDPTAMAPAAVTYGREGPTLFPLTIYAPFNPTLRHLYKSDELAKHARAHEQAAAALEAFEEQECRGFPPATRAACPVLGPVSVEDLPDGVRLHLPPQMPIEATLAHMRCHLAYARVRGFAPTASCPLYLRGTRIERHGDAIDLVSGDKSTAQRLQKLARE